jgi:hypothetical protein
MLRTSHAIGEWFFDFDADTDFDFGKIFPALI